MLAKTLTIVGILMLQDVVNGQTYDDSLQLRSDLLTNYSKDLIPVANTSSRLDVMIQSIIYNIPELDPITGSIELVMSFVVTWTDARMQWNPADYGGMSSIHIQDEHVWYPPIRLGTPIQMQTLGGGDRVHFQSDGTAVWTPGIVVDSSCNYNMRYWPYDKQTCVVRFFVRDYTLDKVRLFQLEQGINTDVYAQGAEWILEEATVDFIEIMNKSLVSYNFKLKRESLFYVLTLILPLFWLGLLSSLVFLLPSDSGERVGFSITILLSIAVFFTMIGGEMPKSASPLSLMCVFVMLLLAISILSTVFAIYSLMLYHREPEIPVGKWYKKMHKLANKRFWSMSKMSKDKVTPLQIRKVDLTKINKDDTGKIKEADNDDDDSDVVWTDVSKAFDKLMFVTLTVLCVVPSVIFLIYISAASDYATLS